MKNIVFIIAIAVLAFACNPNKDLYEKLDNLEVPYNESITYNLTSTDYTTISNAALKNATNKYDSITARYVSSTKCLNQNVKGMLYIPSILAKQFLALNLNSAAKVVFKFSHYRVLFDTEDKKEKYKLLPADYLTMSGGVADSGYFWMSSQVDGAIVPFLNLNFPNYDSTSVMFVTYKIKESNLTKERGKLYYKNGAKWAIHSNAYVIKDDDYLSMGLSYSNFSSTALHSNYLPVFLKTKYPYATPNTFITIAFHYYSSGVTDIYYTRYFFNGTQWLEYETTSELYSHDGEKWIFAPIVNYKMVTADYKILVDYISNHPVYFGYFDTIYKNSEYYYGASNGFSNIDLRISKRKSWDPLKLLDGKTDDEIKTIMFDRLHEGINIFLETKFVDAQPFSNGVRVHYDVVFDSYDAPLRPVYKMRYACMDIGKFEYVSGPTLVQ